jgi:hypothetical protein
MGKETGITPFNPSVAGWVHGPFKLAIDIDKNAQKYFAVQKKNAPFSGAFSCYLGGRV